MIVVAVAVAVGAAGAAGDLRQIVARDAERAAFSETCEHYRVRAEAGAGTARRGSSGDFVIFLAVACGAAEVSLDTGTSKQRARAALLLSRITLLRETISLMNAERAAASMKTNGGTGAFTRFPVTPSGEFLIAHRMGLMIAFDAWLDTGVDFSLAFSR
jgi:hypothetical protein